LFYPTLTQKNEQHIVEATLEGALGLGMQPSKNSSSELGHSQMVRTRFENNK